MPRPSLPTNQPEHDLLATKLRVTIARMPQRARISSLRSPAYIAFAGLVVACSGGGSNSPLSSNAPPEMLLSRARVVNAHRFAEVALRTSRNLGTGRISDRTGIETHARLHPDGSRVVFARQRFNDDPRSRELFVSTIDGSAAELRLTINAELDDHPVWSPDGTQILYTSEENGAPGLWICSDNGGNGQPFLPTPLGFSDSEADWNAATDKIVFSRQDASGRHVLWLVNGSGFGEIPLTDGGSTIGSQNGDLQPEIPPIP